LTPGGSLRREKATGESGIQTKHAEIPLRKRKTREKGKGLSHLERQLKGQNALETNKGRIIFYHACGFKGGWVEATSKNFVLRKPHRVT